MHQHPHFYALIITKLMAVWYGNIKQICVRVFAIAAIVSLNACGQKGALYLPTQTVQENGTIIAPDLPSQAY